MFGNPNELKENHEVNIGNVPKDYNLYEEKKILNEYNTLEAKFQDNELNDLSNLTNPNKLFILQFPKGSLSKLSINNLSGYAGSANIDKKGQIMLNLNGAQFNIQKGIKVKSNIEFATLDKHTNILHILGNIEKRYIAMQE